VKREEVVSGQRLVAVEEAQNWDVEFQGEVVATGVGTGVAGTML
jgi:hypothetical protein